MYLGTDRSTQRLAGMIELLPQPQRCRPADHTRSDTRAFSCFSMVYIGLRLSALVCSNPSTLRHFSSVLFHNAPGFHASPLD
jgi:hypothetical protein